MSEDQINLQETLSGIGESLRSIESKVAGQEALVGQINYLFATVSALDYVLKRMMASHAATFPYGIVREMLDNEELLFANINAKPELSEEYRKTMTFHLAMMLRDTRTFLEQSQSTPPPEAEQIDD